MSGPFWLGAETTDARCTALARLTSLAYTGSDPRPGLPVPDGARDRPADVRARLAAGARYLVLEGPDGELHGAACVAAAGGNRTGEDEMYLERIVTAPAARGHRVLAIVLAAAAETALHEGLRALALDAVVERCLPSVYVRHGFRPMRWWHPSDKPLSEVTMTWSPRDPPEPRPLAVGTVVVWAATGPATVSAHLLGDSASDTPVAGVDVRSYVGGVAGGHPIPDTDPRFLMPRLGDPTAMTVWRTAPGRPTPLGELLALLPFLPAIGDPTRTHPQNEVLT